MSASAFNSAACPYTCVVRMSAFNNDCPLVICYGLIPYLLFCKMQPLVDLNIIIQFYLCHFC